MSQIRKLLSTFVSDEGLARLSSTEVDSARLETRTVEYVWLWLIDDDECASGIGRAVGLGGQFDAFVGPILPPIVTFWFGVLPHLPERKESKTQLIEALKKEFGSKAKLYHGHGPAQIGNVGSANRFTFTPVLHGRSQLLFDLGALGAGEYREYAKRG